MKNVPTRININRFMVSGADELMVSELYMEEVLKQEGFTEIEDKYGVDSNLVCEYAIWELGFENIGDCGEGFIFVQQIGKISPQLLDKYFREGRKMMSEIDRKDTKFYEERGEAFNKFEEMLNRLEKNRQITQLEKVLGTDCKWDLTENNEDFESGHVDYIFENEEMFVEALKRTLEIIKGNIPEIEAYSPEDFNSFSHEYLDDLYGELHNPDKVHREVESVYEVTTGILGETPKTEVMTKDLLTALKKQWGLLKRCYQKESDYWQDFSKFFARVNISEYKDEENGGLFEYRCFQYYSMDEVKEITVTRHELI